jgi:hypothetical protein
VNVPYCHVTCPALHYFSTLSPKRHDFREKKILNIKRVFWFSLHLSEIFLILRRSERDVIKMYIGLHVKYPLFLSNFNEILIFSTDFRKIIKYQISWKSVLCDPISSMRTDRRLYMMKLIVTLRNFANAPNTVTLNHRRMSYWPHNGLSDICGWTCRMCTLGYKSNT